jgi:hypothetical protein
MSLLTEAQQLALRPGGTCGVALLVLSPEERAELDEALASRVASEAIARAMEKRGHTIKYQTIARHRRGACACP